MKSIITIIAICLVSVSFVSNVNAQNASELETKLVETKAHYQNLKKNLDANPNSEDQALKDKVEYLRVEVQKLETEIEKASSVKEEKSFEDMTDAEKQKYEDEVSKTSKGNSPSKSSNSTGAVKPKKSNK